MLEAGAPRERRGVRLGIRSHDPEKRRDTVAPSSHGLARGQQVPLPGAGRAGVRRVKVSWPPLPLVAPYPLPGARG